MLVVRCWAQFLNHEGWNLPGPLPPGTFDAHRFVRSIKGEPLKDANVPVGGGNFVLVRAGDQAAAVDVASWWLSGVVGPAVAAGALLVPIPSSKCAVTNTTVGVAELLAHATAARLGVPQSVVAALRFSEELQSARKGGPRWAHALYPYLRQVADVPRGAHVVLVDDVLTSGGHMQACSAFLRERGAVVSGGACPGRTNGIPLADPWSVPDSQYEDWAPVEF